MDIREIVIMIDLWADEIEQCIDKGYHSAQLEPLLARMRTIGKVERL